MRELTTSNAKQRLPRIFRRDKLFCILLATWILAAGGCSSDIGEPTTRVAKDAPSEEPVRVLTLPGVWEPLAFRPGRGATVLLTQTFEDRRYKFILWDIPSGKRLATLYDEDVIEFQCIAFSPDGSLLATAGVAGRTAPPPLCSDLRLWDATSGKTVRILARTPQGGRNSPSYAVRAIAFSPDGKLLAANEPTGDVGCGAERPVNLWDVASGKVVRSVAGANALVDDVAYSPDGAQIAVVTDNVFVDNVNICDVATGKRVRTIPRCSDGNEVSRAAFSPDGKLLAFTGYADNCVIDLWDREAGQYAAALRGHKERINDLAFRADSRWLASASADGTVRLWDVRKRKLVHTLSVGGCSGAVAFSPNGRWLAVQTQYYSPSDLKSEVSIWELGKDPTK